MQRDLIFFFCAPRVRTPDKKENSQNGQRSTQIDACLCITIYIFHRGSSERDACRQDKALDEADQDRAVCPTPVRNTEPPASFSN